MKFTTKQTRCFLENNFPLEEIQKIALNEGNSKKPIYHIHKWWARRVGSVFRTILISSFLKSNEPYQSFRTKYYNGFSLNDKIVYDPMMGGGTTVVEALKLGCNVIGCDINPVAWFVTKKEVERFDEGLMDSYYQDLENNVGNEIKKMYETTCIKGHKCESVYSIWIRRIQCRNCKKNVDLFGDIIIRHDGKTDTVVCPKCDAIFCIKEGRKQVKCNSCKSIFDKNYKTIERGIFNCPICNKKESVIDHIKRNGKVLSSRLFCIEYNCNICGRGYKHASRNDLKIFERARRKFLKNKKNLLFPKQKIPVNYIHDSRPVSHGFKHFHELFNERQLLCLSLLLKEIKKIPEKNVKEFLLLAFSSSLETNNVLCKYETNWGKISALFGVPAYHVPERYGENNIWGIGRGSFFRTYLKLKRGKKYAQNSYEILYKKKTTRNHIERKFTGESAITNVGCKYSEFLLPGQKAQLFCRDSRKIFTIPPKSVDIVATDPPYFDTIQYSRLADFFYVWLRLILKDYYSWFIPSTSKRSREVVAKSISQSDTNGFVSGLTTILKECHRVLKDDGKLVFTFHHTKKWAWIGLKNAIRSSGFTVTTTQVVHSEGRTGFRKDGHINYDVCVICRKLEKTNSINEGHPISLGYYHKIIRSMQKIDTYLKPNDIFTVLMSGYLISDNTHADNVINNVESLISQINRFSVVNQQ